MSDDTDGELLTFFRALAGPERLRVAGVLAAPGARLTTSEVAARTELGIREVRACLAALVEAGLAEEDGGRYRLAVELLRQRAARRLTSATARARSAATDERERVLASFFRDGRLLKLPTGDRRRDVVLDEIARAFEPERAYPEREVNDILRRYHDDYATLRRWLVDLRYLTREHGIYRVRDRG